MKHFAFARLLPWLLITACPPLLGHCGGAVEHGTETGNPPVVEQQKLHIVLRDTGVEVVGDPGAVSPGASVRVTNRSTGASVEARAGADGSINVVVPGSLQDEYEVTVSNGAGSQTVQVTTQTNSGGSPDAGSPAMTVPPGPDAVACAALQQTLAARVSAGFANLDNTCQRDEECLFVSTNTACYSSCEQVIASVSGAGVSSAAAARAVLQDIAPLCNEFDSQHCEIPNPTCVEGAPVLACNGTCTTFDSLSCGDLPMRAAVRVTNAAKDASRACSLDSDCALVQAEIRCVPSCGNLQSVAATAAQGLRDSIAQTQNLYCGQAESRGCPVPIQLPCVPLLETPVAHCNAGQCEVNYTGPT